MLNHVQLSQPAVVKGIIGSMDDVAQSVLLRKSKHGVQEAPHSFHGLNERWPRELHQLRSKDGICDTTHNL